MDLITCQNLSVGYSGISVHDNINFTIKQGDYLCILGENGSGKSTLMKTLLGLQSPVGGTITYADEFSAKDIGYLPQQTIVQKDFPASVYEIVLSGCLNQCGLRPFYTKQQKKLAADNIERLGITNLSKRCFRELSGGQQQKTLLARALCSAKSVLLLDEPVTGLDPQATNDMYDIIKNLNKEGITIIMISHDQSSSYEYASHILYLGKETYFKENNTKEKEEQK